MLGAGLPWHQLITTFPQLLKHYRPKQQVLNMAQLAGVCTIAHAIDIPSQMEEALHRRNALKSVWDGMLVLKEHCK